LSTEPTSDYGLVQSRSISFVTSKEKRQPKIKP
jgi:hypothetical protein